MSDLKITESYRCRYCGQRGDLRWVVTHSHSHPGETSRALAALWWAGEWFYADRITAWLLRKLGR